MSLAGAAKHIHLDDLRRAISADATLAHDIAAGEVLYGAERGRELQAIAESAHRHADAG